MTFLPTLAGTVKRKTFSGAVPVEVVVTAVLVAVEVLVGVVEELADVEDVLVVVVVVVVAILPSYLSSTLETLTKRYLSVCLDGGASVR